MRFKILILFFCGILISPAITAAAAANPVVLILGDSLSASHGIGQQQGWGNLLALRLRQRGFPHHVVNVSISGETTSGGVSRLKPALERHRPSVVIIQLGANDGLRGLPLIQMRKNLQQLIQSAKESDARVLLIGMHLPPNYGPRYTRTFQNIFLELAKENDIAVVPFLLEGVSEQRELMQADNLHPTAEAQSKLLENIWPTLLPLLSQ